MTLPTFGDLLVNPEHTAWAESTLAHLGSQAFADKVDEAEKASLSDDDSDEDFWSPEASWARPYRVRNGVLHVPVKGMLLNGFPYAFGSWATGYEYITAAVKRGIGDVDVDMIVLDINSPGGYVSGCFDCADSIYAARAEKPIHAAANEHAYSAAYAIACSASTIAVGRTGGVGSIGVIATHVEQSKMLDNIGVKFTLIYAGKRKADGNPYEALSAEARAEVEERVNAHYDIFVATVARNRDMEEAAVRATEAGCFMPQQAIEVGLADTVGTLDETLSALADSVTTQGDDDMTLKTPAADAAATHEAALNAARAEGATAGKAEATAAAATVATAAAATERTRISAIIGSEEAKTRPSAARMLAMNTDMTPEAAAKALATLPGEAAAATADDTSFVDAMNAEGTPGITGGLQAPVDTNDRVARAFAAAGVPYKG